MTSLNTSPEPEPLPLPHSTPADSLELEGRLIKLLESPLSLVQIVRRLGLDFDPDNIQAVDRALNELIEQGTARRYSIEKLSHWIVISNN